MKRVNHILLFIALKITEMVGFSFCLGAVCLGLYHGGRFIMRIIFNERFLLHEGDISLGIMDAMMGWIFLLLGCGIAFGIGYLAYELMMWNWRLAGEILEKRNKKSSKH